MSVKRFDTKLDFTHEHMMSETEAGKYVLAADYDALVAERTALIEVLTEATDFVDAHSESWYRSGQALLTKCRAALAGSALETEGDANG